MSVLTAVAVITFFGACTHKKLKTNTETKSVNKDFLFGVTIDSIENLPATLHALKTLSHRPISRIVFDEQVSARAYQKAVMQIHQVSGVMAEVVDSQAVKKYSVKEYIQRTKEYYYALSPYVDIWEIGNEVNGEWLGKASVVSQKISGAFDFIKAQTKTTALTLYYNEGCTKYPDEEVFAWISKNIPSRLQNGLDYVFISYYEDDCNGLRPDWEKVFAKLAQFFPNSKLGFGEIGTTVSLQRKKEMINRYYGLRLSQERFVGGYFWWYFLTDMVPASKDLWPVLNASPQGN